MFFATRCAFLRYAEARRRRVPCETYADYSPRKDSAILWLLYSVLSTWIPVCMDNNPPETPIRRSIVPPRVVRGESSRSSTIRDRERERDRWIDRNRQPRIFAHIANMFALSMRHTSVATMEICRARGRIRCWTFQLVRDAIFLTWYFLGNGCWCFTRLHRATELRSSVHSVCNGSCFTLLQKGCIDFPLKY